ncbi:diaminopimelate epimerase [Paenibacillus sp. JSM ZJ436]|uniref:diaminopimelate epimerase n=1 Tax=Paenibacillus sp. JSM ZJ436 TaxID=3376190 RepID=UPI0037C57C54
MEVKFIKTNPTQNMTILVESRHGREDYGQVAQRMMSYDHVFAEQVGFIEQAEGQEAWARLQMMSGEFCGNAAMSLAAVMAWKWNLPLGRSLDIPLEVSGADQLLSCRVTADAAPGYTCRLELPPPLSIEPSVLLLRESALTISAALVRYPGICHAILEVAPGEVNLRSIAEQAVQSLAAICDEQAVGIMLYCPDTQEMEPLVYIPAANSLVWERGCGSGAAAVGAWLARQQQRHIHTQIKQPGGTMDVWAQIENRQITRLAIQGQVHISASGTAYI